MIKLGVPYSALHTKLDIINTREDEAMAMAAGIELAGGEACVYMQDDGYLHTLNVTTTLLIPYEMTVFVQVYPRNDLEHHKYASNLRIAIWSYVAGKLPYV